MVISKALRAVWDEPRGPAPATRPWWDIAVVAVLVPSAVLEGIAQRRPLARVHTRSLCRSSAPGGAVAGAVPVGDARARLRCADPGRGGPALAGLDYGVLNATAVVLLFPTPWRGGARAGTSSSACSCSRSVTSCASRFTVSGLQENLIGAGSCCSGCAAAVRFFISLRRRGPRECGYGNAINSPGELHDTVAHHVSGIVIQARAGRTGRHGHGRRSRRASRDRADSHYRIGGHAPAGDRPAR